MVKVYNKDSSQQSASNSSIKKDQDQKKPKFAARIIISFLFAIVFFCLFALTYTNSVNLSPYYLTQDFFNEYVSYASEKSTDKFYEAISNQCDDLLELFYIIEVDLSFNEETIRKKLSESGLKDSEIEKVIDIHKYCKNTVYSKDVFFNKTIIYLLEENNISNETSNIEIIENLENVLPSSNSNENEELNNNDDFFRKLLLAISFSLEMFFNTGKIIALLVVCLILIVILGFNHLYYISNKMIKVFLKLGIFLLIPYVILSFYMRINVIDTSLVFSKFGEFLSSDTNFQFSTILNSLLKNSILILMKILYPSKLALKGLIITVLSIAGLIFLKKSKDKEIFNSEKID